MSNDSALTDSGRQLESQPRLVDPRTGELLERVHQLPPETLADVLDAIRSRQRELKEMAAIAEEELRRRLALRGRAVATFGEFEVAAKGSNESSWDGDELEGVLRALIDDGILAAAECTEVIRHQTTVSRTEANKLLGRLQGEAKSAVERCRQWHHKPSRVEVTRSQPLIGERPQ